MQPQRKPMERGFTLIELLIVITVLSILAAILFPVFAGVKEKARQVACLSNQRQLASAFQLYAQDYDETLPFFGDRYPRSRVFWPHLLQPYLHTEDVMECASWPKRGKYENRLGVSVDGRHGIGANYGELFRYAVKDGIHNPPTPLTMVHRPSQTLLLTDAQGAFHVYSLAVWPLTVDWDRDGLNDSHPGVLTLEGPYNRGDPFRHNGGAICTFADGHARWITARNWLTNADNLWAMH